MKIEEIQKAYPNPTTWEEQNVRHNRDYCVGGAFCNFIDGRFTGQQFPDEDILAEAILETNPALEISDASKYAVAIINRNDDGYINDAWQMLAMALEDAS